MKSLLIFLSTSLISIVYLCLSHNTASYLIVYVVSLSFYVFLFRGVNASYWAVFSYCLLLSVYPLYEISLVNYHGSAFSVGGDAERYFDSSMRFAETGVIEYTRYWIYTYSIGKYFYVLKYFGVEVDALHHSMVTMFVSSLGIPFVYKTYLNLSSESNNKARALTLLFLITPFYLILAIGQLRDIYSYIAPFYIFYIISKHHRYNKITILEVSLATVLVIYSYFIRTDVFAACLVMSGSYIALKSIDNSLKIIISILLLFLFGVFLNSIGLFERFSFANLSHEINNYNQQCTVNCSSDSFIGKLRGLPLGFIVLMVFSYYSPLPIFFLDNKYTFFYAYEAIFFAIWLPASVYLIYLLNKIELYKNKFLLSFVICSVFVLLLLSLTTAGFYRQKLYLYPIIYYLISLGFMKATVEKSHIKILCICSIVLVFFITFVISRYVL